ncbi:hypothetical protein PROFUN_10802 [Planoprotostelium fungivorum]|uniref:Peptidase M1 leukotriene A4 hydrolase/aminopeptidase C-terminal domain-containing protein n=1 Tax=Planoprotostelium fungivorum TaxID=1890364 RepID=A0A2P6NCZ0_9EUKA|nr:hypothetical protein PROFUN_10802 [Planoprotostelium fungivorum]
MSFDLHSHGNIHEIVTRHISLLWNVVFEKKVIEGQASFTGEALVDGVSTFVFDSKDLDIHSAADSNGESLKFTLDAYHEVFGHALTVQLGSPLKKGDKVTISVKYSSRPTSSAIQWLSPEQTADKKHPYLFTQCQAIHARTMLPCQDAPSVKATYEASVTVPKALTAVMSAVNSQDDTIHGDLRTFFFIQKIPTSSYLIALGVGDLVSKDIGPRTRVWSEPSFVERGAYEFAETEEFIQVAEKHLGPYVWGRYDILLLPPSFPYGGMENPCLTFVTPTLLAGDRSLADVVAHEISHSWSGNYVTNKTWEHFWLNEGWTVYNERIIHGALHGEKERHFKALQGLKALDDSIEMFGKESPHTALYQKLDGIDPDDAFSSVPYEKGFNFLFYLETLVGGLEPFLAFARVYLDKFKFSTVTTEQFKELFLEHFEGKVEKAKLDSIDWEKWLYAPGDLPVPPKFDESIARASIDLGDRWLEKGEGQASDIAGWNAGQICLFLDTIITSPKSLSTETAEKMDKAYNLNASKNAEVRFRWYTIGIKAEYEPVFEKAAGFLVEQGRMKYVRPLYRTLKKSQKGSELAVKTFKEHGQLYHSIAAKMIAKDLGL